MQSHSRQIRDTGRVLISLFDCSKGYSIWSARKCGYSSEDYFYIQPIHAALRKPQEHSLIDKYFIHSLFQRMLTRAALNSRESVLHRKT